MKILHRMLSCAIAALASLPCTATVSYTLSGEFLGDRTILFTLEVPDFIQSGTTTVAAEDMVSCQVNTTGSCMQAIFFPDALSAGLSFEPATVIDLWVQDDPVMTSMQYYYFPSWAFKTPGIYNTNPDYTPRPGMLTVTVDGQPPVPAVPEPASIALCGVGLLAVGLAARQRAK